MNENRLMQQVVAIFSVFMVFFYVGVGLFLIFYSDLSTIAKPVRVMLGSTFLLYGIYRGFRAYLKIVEAFFRKGNKDDEDEYRQNRTKRYR